MHYLFVFVFVFSNLLNYSSLCGAINGIQNFGYVLSEAKKGHPALLEVFFLEEEIEDSEVGESKSALSNGDLTTSQSLVHKAIYCLFTGINILIEGRNLEFQPLYLWFQNFRI